MRQKAGMGVWQGRVDPEPGVASLRWHQHVMSAEKAKDFSHIALLGMCCDAGVARNQGRVGASEGPQVARRALSSLAWHRPRLPLLDYGDVECCGDELEEAQQQLAGQVTTALRQQGAPLVIGGGHEMALGSFQGLWNYLDVSQRGRVGILNFDAHFDLRNFRGEHARPSSGSPFLQAAELCKEAVQPFQYACLGVSRGANTHTLFQVAEQLNVLWYEDRDLVWPRLDVVKEDLHDFLKEVEYLYLSIDLDVLPAAQMPAVSAPAGRGVTLEILDELLSWLQLEQEVLGFRVCVADLAEFNPRFDVDNHGARTLAFLASRLVGLLAPAGVGEVPG